MILSTIIPDYENRNASIDYILVENPIKYFYPVRYGYDRARLKYSLALPAYKISKTTSLGLEDFLGQRQDVIDAKIRMILKEIDQRRILKDDNIYGINLDQCTCRNLIHHLGPTNMDKRWVDLEKKTIDLEEEKRKENANYFRDIMFLRKELRESIIEDVEENQKAAILMN